MDDRDSSDDDAKPRDERPPSAVYVYDEDRSRSPSVVYASDEEILDQLLPHVNYENDGRVLPNRAPSVTYVYEDEQYFFYKIS